MLTKNEIAAFRRAYSIHMTCRECGGEMMIGDSGLVCSNGCGKIKRPVLSYRDLMEAYPERVIPKRRSGMSVNPVDRAVPAKVRKSHPRLFVDEVAGVKRKSVQPENLDASDPPF